MHAREKMDSVYGCSELWAILWECVIDTAEMVYSLLHRRNRNAFVIVWLHTDKGMFCFCRMIMCQSAVSCMHELAAAVEDEIKVATKDIGVVPSPPPDRHARAKAHTLRDDDSRWHVQTLDTASRENIAYVNRARSTPHTSGFFYAQSGFRCIVSTCFATCLQH